MSATSTALTVKVESGSPYQLSKDQTLKASKALLKHIATTSAEKAKTAPKKSLLEAESDDTPDEDQTPIWLNLTTKVHIVDKTRLKPSKIAVPHSLHASPTETICLITADPQRAYKDLVASPAFPEHLRKRITRVIGIEKIKKKYNQYEAQRQLRAEHEIFLADDRIVNMLGGALGKTFYKSQHTRPIPVVLANQVKKTEEEKKARGQNVNLKQGKGANPPADAQTVAKEIEKALNATLVTLGPSVNTSVKVGYSGWEAEKLAENVEAVVNGLVERFVPKKWRGVRALHITGHNTVSLPIWLADELWIDEQQVLDAEGVKAIEAAKEAKKQPKEKKRKRLGEAAEEKSAESNQKKSKKQKALPESNDTSLDAEIALRKAKLKQQKEEVVEGIEDSVPKPKKKAKALAKAVAA